MQDSKPTINSDLLDDRMNDRVMQELSHLFEGSRQWKVQCYIQKGKQALL